MTTNGMTIDTREFQAALKRYMPHTKRTLAEIINQKSFSTVTTASKVTKKATKEEIKGAALEEIMGQRHKANKKGIVLPPSPGPRISLIVNRRLGRANALGLYGDAQAEASDKALKKRYSSIGFLRSGWLVAVSIFASAIGKAVSKSTARSVKRMTEKGYGVIGGGTPAKPGVNPTASFFTEAFSKITNAARALKISEEGLQKALNQTVVRMDQHIEQKLQAETDKVLGRMLR